LRSSTPIPKPPRRRSPVSNQNSTYRTPRSITTLFLTISSERHHKPRRANRGGFGKREKAAAALFEHKYVNGYGAHAPMETHTALAVVERGGAFVWTSTQVPFPNRQQVAQALGLPLQKVRIFTPFVGGGFGGKSSTGLQAVEAARLSKATGKPVQVCWNRAEEFFYDTFRPAAVVKVKSGIDGKGKVVLWDYQVYFAGSRSASSSTMCRTT